ncbi:LuxR family two component transcriptional regulator [Kribbella kalugense]|uniref:LuxR family two component transcriptional regulator n=1 Tax=Kribbella kalugense TaxID=2512221 RepID=A0A4R7ZLM9_9ACTN|nr:LuxR family two component transcriptional regulator [Kribbella kalugense]
MTKYGHNHCVSDKIRVLVADDQRLVRTGFRVILEAEGDIEVVAEADTGTEAIRQAQLVAPDVILMDIRMPELDGLSATEQIRRQPDPPTIIVLTTFDQNEYVYRALRAGAAGFLLKDSPSTRLIAAVRAAATGDSLIEPAITRRLVEQFVEPVVPQGLPAELQTLTERELEVLRLIARGLSNAEIAAELVVAETTVKTHVARLLTKLGVRDRVQAVVVAYETGFANRR